MEVSSIISIDIETLTVNEDIGTAIIPLVRTGDLNFESLVDYSINDSSAQSGQDFTAIFGTLSFAPGETIQEIRVPIIDDNLFETDETFSVAIGNPTGALLGGIRTANIVIQDNDSI